MGYEQIIPLPDRSIGRSGRDLFLSHKDVTVIMAPYERYSVFPEAVDHLYRSMAIPFNLIVVEGNSPEPVRLALEKRQRRHGNMTIIYTNHCPSLPNAFNLALPHFKTPYALLIDNGIRLPKGSLESFLEAARTSQAPLLCPKNSMLHRPVHKSKAGERPVLQTMETFGLRPCFLISQEVVRELGKLFDEFSSLYTLGVDFISKIRSKGLRIQTVESAKVETVGEGSIRAMDLPLFRVQWNRERLLQSLEQLEKKWGIHLAEDPLYNHWIQSKVEEGEKPARMEVVFNRLISGVRETGWKRVQDAASQFRLGLSKSSYFSKIKMNISR